MQRHNALRLWVASVAVVIGVTARAAAMEPEAPPSWAVASLWVERPVAFDAAVCSLAGDGWLAPQRFSAGNATVEPEAPPSRAAAGQEARPSSSSAEPGV